MKREAAEAALDYIQNGDVIGVGTGSTVNHFIDALAAVRGRIDGAVASSRASAERLRGLGIRVLELNQTGDLPLYVDGADEANRARQLIKGGGAALTGEKIVAAASARFVCIVDETKVVDILGEFPLPIEVISMAQSYVGRQLVKLVARPELREGTVTDHGNPIIDVRNLDLVDPVAMERRLNDMAGVVTNGLFAIRPADVVLAGGDGVRKL